MGTRGTCDPTRIGNWEPKPDTRDLGRRRVASTVDIWENTVYVVDNRSYGTECDFPYIYVHDQAR